MSVKCGCEVEAMAVEVGNCPAGSTMVLWGSSPGSHACLYCFDELGERLAPRSGTKNDVGGEVGCAVSEYALSSHLKVGAFTNDMGWGLQWGMPTLTTMRIGCARSVSGVVFPSEGMLCEERDCHAENRSGCLSDAHHELWWFPRRWMV